MLQARIARNTISSTSPTTIHGWEPLAWITPPGSCSGAVATSVRSSGSVASNRGPPTPSLCVSSSGRRSSCATSAGSHGGGVAGASSVRRPCYTRDASRSPFGDLGPRRREAVEDGALHAVERDPLLGHRVPITQGDGVVLEGFDVDRHAPWRPDLILAPIELADRRRVVVDGEDVAGKVRAQRMAQRDDLGPLLEERQNGDLVRRQLGIESEHDALLAANLLLPIRVDEERECGAIRTGRRLDDERDVVLLGRRVEVLEVLPRRSRVRAEIEVAAVVDPFELLPAEREAVLDVDSLLRVVGQLVGRVLARPQALSRDPVAGVPLEAPWQPLLEHGRRGVRPHEVLHLHLLELAHPEDEVAGRDLVPERLADLGDAERDLLARALLDVLEVDVRALGSLGAEVDDRGVVLDRAHVAREHEVETARRREQRPVVGAQQVEPLRDGLVAEVGLGEVLRARKLVEP